MKQEITYLKAAATARVLRKALKAEFPETKFSVRTETYAGGASIDIDYTSGPTWDEMKKFVKPFEGAAFDAMVDYQTKVNAWILPDGTVQVAQVSGTESMGGYIPEISNPAPTADAQLVHFGADYIFHRQHEA